MKEISNYIVGIMIYFLVVPCCNAQFSENRKRVNSTVVPKNVQYSDMINVVDYLPRKYVKDGSIDYTKYVQKVLDKHSNIRFPNFPIQISNLTLKSNSVLEFDINGSLIIKPTYSSFYAGLLIDQVDNVKIYNLNIKGDRIKHLGKGGEHGFGVEIKNATNVIIDGFTISECWGDGIIIDDRPEKKRRTNNITVTNGVLDFNRRDGISVISGDNITLSNLSIYNTMGTNPMAGIMIEPNHSANTLGKIVINNVVFDNNVIGLGLNFDNYFDGGVSKPIDLIVSKVNIKNSSVAVNAVSNRTEKHLKKISGSIKMINVSYKNNAKKSNLPKQPQMIPTIQGIKN